MTMPIGSSAGDDMFAGMNRPPCAISLRTSSADLFGRASYHFSVTKPARECIWEHSGAVPRRLQPLLQSKSLARPSRSP